MSPKIEKQQFRNETNGYVGAVTIGPKGDERGVAVEAGGTIWLSEAEQILTANAPRKPEDNPFIEQTLIRTNPETGAAEEYRVTPLVPVSENRYVPANERPIPGDLGQRAPVLQDAAQEEESTVLVPSDATVESRTQEIAGDPRPQPPRPAPPRAARAAAAAAQAAEEAPEAPQAPQEGPEQPQPAGPPPPVAPTPPGAQERSDTPSPTGEEEETAAMSPGPHSEETGAALPPTGDAPQGEYARAEEVGTPVGETGSDSEGDDDAEQRPAPYSPPEE